MTDKTPQKDAKEAVAGWIDTQSPTPTDDEMTRTGSITDPALQQEEGETGMTDLDAQVKVTVPEKEPDVKVEVDVETPAEPTDDDQKEDAS